MSEPTPPKSRSFRKPGCIFAILLLLLGIGLVPVLVRKFDTYLVNTMSQRVVRSGPEEPEPYDAHEFEQILDTLDAIAEDRLMLTDLGVSLPPIRQLLYKVGFHRLSVDDETLKRLRGGVLERLRSMSGEDFGEDMEAWRSWHDERRQLPKAAENGRIPPLDAEEGE